MVDPGGRPGVQLNLQPDSPHGFDPTIQLNPIQLNQLNPIQLNQLNPIQLNPIQLNPIQLNPIQMNPIQF